LFVGALINLTGVSCPKIELQKSLYAWRYITGEGSAQLMRTLLENHTNLYELTAFLCQVP